MTYSIQDKLGTGKVKYYRGEESTTCYKLSRSFGGWNMCENKAILQ